MTLKLIFILVSVYSINGCTPQSLDMSKLISESITTSLSEKRPVKAEITLSEKLNIPVTFEATSKGNGTINIQGLLLKVFDQHDDGTIFKDDFLRLKTQDLNGDGILELIFSGTLVHTGEKESDPATLEPIKAIYTLDCNSGFIKIFESVPNHFIEIFNKQSSAFECE